MCKEELNQIEDIEDEINEEMTLDDMSKDQLINVIEQLMSSKEVDINTENVQELELNPQEFQAGIDSISFLVGQYSALKSVGIDSTSAIDVILNERNIEYNLELNRMTCDNNKEIAKTQQTITEQNQP